MHMMDRMGAMMDGMGILGLLIAILIVLGIFALGKYVFGPPKP